MGLGPINAIYQARFNRYLLNRADRRHQPLEGVVLRRRRRVDEPESLGALSLAAREQLDNLIFVVNCNLQRLDGPVRGNGKIIQELEAIFRGAGWNVIKVIWGSKWDELLARDVDGVLAQQDEHHRRRRVPEVRGRVAAPTSASTSSAPTPACASMVEHLSDDDLRNLPRGGHDYRKLYAAYKAAVEHEGAPDRHPRQDDQGLDARARLRGAQRHAPDQEDDEGRSCKLFRDRLYLQDQIPDEELEAQDAAVLPPGHRLAGVRVHDGAPARARRLAARAGRAPSAGRPARRPTSSTEFDGGLGQEGRCRPPWRSPGCCATCCATRAWASASCRSSPTRPARSAWTRCSRRSKIYAAVRPALRAGRRRAAALVPEATAGPDPRGGHHRGRLDGVLHRRRHRVRHARPADDPVLHLLFDVRLPAHRRPHLGVRRPARPRLPARRHRRPHDAHRRGPPALRRPQPRAGVDVPELPPTTPPSPTRSR